MHALIAQGHQHHEQDESDARHDEEEVGWFRFSGLVLIPVGDGANAIAAALSSPVLIPLLRLQLAAKPLHAGRGRRA